MRRLVLVFTLLLASGCAAQSGAGPIESAAPTQPAGSATPSADPHEAAFLRALDGGTLSTNERAALQLGYALCKQLRLGNVSSQKEIQDWSFSHADGLDDPAVAVVIVDAPKLLCPDWRKY